MEFVQDVRKADWGSIRLPTGDSLGQNARRAPEHRTGAARVSSISASAQVTASYDSRVDAELSP